MEEISGGMPMRYAWHSNLATHPTEPGHIIDRIYGDTGRDFAATFELIGDGLCIR